MEINIKRIDKNTWSFEEPGVRFFLLNGQITGRKENMFGNPIVSYDAGPATFLCDPGEKQ